LGSIDLQGRPTCPQPLTLARVGPDIREIVAHSRLVISLCALCLCACFGISSAYGSSAASHKVQTSSAHAKRKVHRARKCAKRARVSSFHSTSSHGRHTHRNKTCPKSRPKVNHPTVTPNPSPAPPTPANGPSSYGQAPAPPAASGAGPCTDTASVPNRQDLDEVRAAVICLVNRERAAHGETALTANAQLEGSAQAHTDSMVSEDYFEHIGPHGETPVMRMRAAGYISSSRVGYEIGENIGWGTLADSAPRAIVAAWMASPGHRANILNPHFRDTAVGVSPRLPSLLTRMHPAGLYTQDFGVITTG
jgi:uncharacterized protein YkwD